MWSHTHNPYRTSNLCRRICCLYFPTHGFLCHASVNLRTIVSMHHLSYLHLSLILKYYPVLHDSQLAQFTLMCPSHTKCWLTFTTHHLLFPSWYSLPPILYCSKNGQPELLMRCISQKSRVLTNKVNIIYCDGKNLLLDSFIFTAIEFFHRIDARFFNWCALCFIQEIISTCSAKNRKTLSWTPRCDMVVMR